MRVGVFGPAQDLQCRALGRALEERGAQPVSIEPDALDRGLPVSFEDGRATYRGEPVDDLAAYFLRSIPAPYAPYLEKDGELVLFNDWHAAYMQARERASLYVSWLLELVESGTPVVNPPQAASVLQYKPLQLQVLRQVGARVPRTLISNDPARIRAFGAEHKDVIFKPLMGGAITRPLDEAALERLELVRTSPVIFQERVEGDDLRVMVVGERIVSSVAIETQAQHLDFRDDPVYSSGQAGYREVTLPAKVQSYCVEAARRCGLDFAGIDIKHRGDAFVFLELNSSPIYLDVELKLGHPITAALAALLVSRAAARAS